MHIIIRFSKSLESINTVPRVNCDINYGPWVIWYGNVNSLIVTNASPCFRIVGEVVWGQGYMRTLCTLSQFCCEPKTALKNKALLFKK